MTRETEAEKKKQSKNQNAENQRLSSQTKFQNTTTATNPRTTTHKVRKREKKIYQLLNQSVLTLEKEIQAYEEFLDRLMRL